MNSKNKTGSIKKISSSTGILICGAISASAAYFALPGTGIASSLPLLAVCAAICAFIPTDIIVKMLMLPLMTFAFATVLTGNTMHAAYMALLCLVLCGAGVFAKRLAFDKKVILKITAILIICVMLFINTLFCGSAFKNAQYGNMLEDYFESTYADTVTHEHCYYDHTSGLYKIDISSQSSPTVKRSAYIMGGVIYDDYKARAERILTVPVSLQLTSALRQSFGDNDFSVEDARIIGFSPDKIDPTSQDTHGELMEFTVSLGGMMTKEQFFDKAKEYALALEFSDAVYHRITFKGGNGMNDIYMITVRKGLIFADIGIDDVVPCKSNIAIK